MWDLESALGHCFYRDVLGFEIKESEDVGNVYLVKNSILFLLVRRKDFEKMTSAKYEYIKGNNGHFEIALYVCYGQAFLYTYG